MIRKHLNAMFRDTSEILSDIFGNVNNACHVFLTQVT
jgi:hypothetical protein